MAGKKTTAKSALPGSPYFNNYYFQDVELIAPLMDGRVKVIIRESFIDFPDYVPPTNLSRFN